MPGMHTCFTPSAKPGRNYQLFLPFHCFLKEEASQNVGGSSISQGKEDLSLTVQLTNKFAKEENESPGSYKDHQAKVLEESKKVAKKKFAMKELSLQDKDVDDTMSVEAQAKILEDIRKQKDHSHTSGTHPPQDGRHTNDGFHNQVAAQQNSQNRQQKYPPADYYPGTSQGANMQSQPQDPPYVLRAGEMRSQNQQMKYANTNERYPDTQQSQYNPNSAGMPYRAGEANLPQQHYNPPKLVYDQQSSDVPSSHSQPYVSGDPYYQQAGQYYNPPQNAGGQYYGNNQYGQQQVPYNQGDNTYMQTGGSGLPPYSTPSAAYQPPYSNTGQSQWSENYQNYSSTRENAVVQPPINNNPYNLEVGSLIQYGNNPTYTGVIRWIGGHVAGVEMVSLHFTHTCKTNL